MANNLTYRYLRGINKVKGSITFDEKGYIVEAKGFSSLIWCTDSDIDKDLIGKHVDELAEILKEYGESKEIYYDFEIQIHLELLKQMLKDK